MPHFPMFSYSGVAVGPPHFLPLGACSKTDSEITQVQFNMLKLHKLYFVQFEHIKGINLRNTFGKRWGGHAPPTVTPTFSRGLAATAYA